MSAQFCGCDPEAHYRCKEHLRQAEELVDDGRGVLKRLEEEAPPQLGEPRNERTDHDWITTYTGHKFYPLRPRSEDVDIRDIAHALSNQCRFTGHVRRFYSVAQHSILVSQLCAQEDAFWGLMHDASETYLADIARPVKHTKTMAGYRAAEHGLMQTICERFKLSLEEPTSVREADRRILVTEATQLLSTDSWNFTAEPFPLVIVTMNPDECEQAFLDRYHALYFHTPNTEEHPWAI